MEALFYLADQNPERDRSRGITEYTSGLMRALGEIGGFEISSLVSHSSYRAGIDVRRRTLPFRTDHFIGRMLADLLHPLWVPPFPIVHYPKGFLPGLRPKASLVCGTVHDLILQHYIDKYPNSRSKSAFAYWLWVLKRSLPRFDLVLTVSEFSATAIREFCARHRLVCPPIRVTYEGCRWESAPLFRGEKLDQVIHLGSQEPHKQTATLVGFWQALDLPKTKLIIVGSVTEDVRRMVSQRSNIELLGPQSEEELRTSIAGSRALILPSEIEGFGLPAIEAYAVGTPVVYVRQTAVEEVLGSRAPGGFDLSESDSFGPAVNEVLNVSAAQVEAARNDLLARFSWAECIRRTIASYREFLCST